METKERMRREEKGKEEAHWEKPEGHLTACTGNILKGVYLSCNDFSRNPDFQHMTKSMWAAECLREARV